ncbi:hypothetical protein ACWT_5487 [Actinoplanes sp. SE50]|uniref:copper resistance CopC family protein n=1 Tax=unclassified Actinoplanes TaxID=2626549 RepID=UPI00023EC9EC|nr:MULTISPECIES: copper resistance CopC family protein [unclassified Actinoplanes]AEV86504.1 hypothetical protein ACPL_5617 [Actinoplanes sp. SE50/110]ATO84902.1 hypothetical protein ACWT_5487 [Actinoplanes sp. SE50]SLM02311.1 uncharacterized protein ACSP50_5550 [Actinoplanes sp. SE50/110]
MTKRLMVVLAAIVAVLVPAAPALAHNPLVGAVPAKNATVTAAPAEVKLTFLEKLDPATTKLTVTGPDGAAVAEPVVTGKSVTVSFGTPLGNGKYTVAYQLTADDGDVIKSSYTFTVAVAQASPSAAASDAPIAAVSVVPAVTVAAPAAPSQDKGNGPWLGLAAGIGVLVLLGAGIFVFLRRRRTT